MTTAVAVVSGGMDSTTLAYRYAAQVDRLVMVSVNYGQRHVTEIAHARATARVLGSQGDVVHHVVDLQTLGRLLRSALTVGSIAVPHGHYADESMRATVVPNRNAILLNIGIGLAVAEGADRVGTAVHAGDHPVYPDCRPEFIAELQRLALIANEGFIDPAFVVDAPYVNMTKADIVQEGHRLGVEWSNTWSCYEGGTVHCGRCGTCVERHEAFVDAGMQDPTMYAP